jgi:hypothetical protein
VVVGQVKLHPQRALQVGPVGRWVEVVVVKQTKVSVVALPKTEFTLCHKKIQHKFKS